MLKVQNLTKYFGGVKAADNCSFEINKGEITALIGPNGSGKTTVFNLISGIIKPDKGNIYFNNHNLRNRSIDDISNLGIARMFQQSNLFNNLTIKENLMTAIDNEDMKLWKSFFGLNKITPAKIIKVKEILNTLNISETENKLARELSFGQKRLVELARTILNFCELLILDEPLAGINPRLHQKIIDIFSNLKKNDKTIFFIEHNIHFAFKIADKVIVMDAGKIIAEDKPKNIKVNSRVIEAYL